MKNSGRIAGESTKLDQAADVALKKLMSMNDEAFDSFIDAHMDGDIARYFCTATLFQRKYTLSLVGSMNGHRRRGLLCLWPPNT